MLRIMLGKKLHRRRSLLNGNKTVTLCFDPPQYLADQSATHSVRLDDDQGALSLGFSHTCEPNCHNLEEIFRMEHC